MTDFRLDKWYFDCVSSDGAVLIGYAVRLKWGVVRIGYGARMTKPDDDGPLSQTQSLSFGQVDEAPGVIRWSNDSLRVEGTWAGGHGFGNTLLLDGPDGRIEWQCLSANARVAARVDSNAVEGLGYAERISMTIPPWRLPFKELRWGRYISDSGNDYAVWIDLQGTYQRNWTWMNGGMAVEGIADDAGARVDGGELNFMSSQPIRRDNIARTLLGRFQFLAKLVPREIRIIQEHKQLSTCVLTCEGSESRGSSINELVRWL